MCACAALAANFILLQLVVAAMLEFLKDPVRFVYPRAHHSECVPHTSDLSAAVALYLPHPIFIVLDCPRAVGVLQWPVAVIGNPKIGGMTSSIRYPSLLALHF
jgi:hypothetical protein